MDLKCQQGLIGSLYLFPHSSEIKPYSCFPPRPLSSSLFLPDLLRLSESLSTPSLKSTTFHSMLTPYTKKHLKKRKKLQVVSDDIVFVECVDIMYHWTGKRWTFLALPFYYKMNTNQEITSVWPEASRRIVKEISFKIC